MKASHYCYLIGGVDFHIAWLIIIHQWYTGYYFQWSQLGGLHHETLAAVFFIGALIFVFVGSLLRLRIEKVVT